MRKSAAARLAAALLALSCIAATPPAAPAGSLPSPAALECANAQLPAAILDGLPARSGPTSLKTFTVRVPNANLVLAAAAGEENRTLGLMCVVRLRERAGMIFEFPSDGNWEFWMKNTLIPLDMLWVESDGAVNSVASDVPASTLQTSDDAVARRSGYGRYVIELRGGEARRDGIVAGTRLKLPLLGSMVCAHGALERYIDGTTSCPPGSLK